MAKELILQHENKDYNFSPTKLDRKKLYGWKDIVAFDPNGNECTKVDIDETGSLIVPKGGRALAILDKEGKWVDKSQLKPVRNDGKEAVLIPSSFDQPIKLDNKVSVEQFMDYSIESVYILDSNEIPTAFVQHIKDSEDIYTFPFNFRPSYESIQAFLIESQNKLFLLLGYLNTFEFIGFEEQAEISAEDEEEEQTESDDELDFSF